jgi:ABC-2 type transport system permease protein
MQHRGDAEAEPAARRWRATVQARERWTMRALVLFPPALFQRALNPTAGMDLQSHLAYLDAVIAYHEALKAWFFPAIFDNRTVAEMDWSSAPRHEHVAAPRRDAFVAGAGTLLAIAAALIGVAGLVLARRLTPGESLRTRQLKPVRPSGVVS